MDEKTEPLYAAAVGYMVSSRTNHDSWAAIATRVHQLIQQGATRDTIGAQFQAVEAKVKEDFKLTQMPTAWRTAKHTVLKALEAGVVFVDKDGSPLGKSAVDRACRMKAPIPPVLSDTAFIITQLGQIYEAAKTLSPSATEKPVLVELCKRLHFVVAGLSTHA